MFHLESVVPWGRSCDEYRRMFALSDADLELRILGCADGPAGFNAEWTAAGGTVVSFDPIYGCSPGEIRRRIDETCDRMIEQARRNAEMFVWSEPFGDADDLGRYRLATMNRFLSDFPTGRADGRYIAAGFPTLPFAEQSFDVALCSHFLFLYSEQLSLQFHVDCVFEMLRVAREARIFPVTELSAAPSRHVRAVTSAVCDAGFRVDVKPVDYEFVRGSNQQMRITR